MSAYNIPWVVLAILVVHYVADYIAQTDEMAKNKSTSLKWLGAHVGSYVAVMMLLVPWVGFKYIFVQGILHFVVDFNTSKLNRYLWISEKRHAFFNALGLDQLIHTICLIGLLGVV